MDNVVNLSEYRKAKEDAEIEEDVAYLRAILDQILEALPPMELEPYTPENEYVPSFLMPQATPDGYEDPK